MKLFVTGGAGYIGSAVSAELLAGGHSVTVYDSLVTGHREAVPEGAAFVQGDLLDSAALEAALGKGYDAVLHFAAFIEAGESMRDPGKYFRNNLQGTLGLVEAAHKAGVGRFVFSSSAAVYRTSDEPLSEDAPLGPENTYGQTKLISEQILNRYQQIYALRYAALRYFNACGALPGRGEAHQPESHLIPLILQVALEQRESISIFGSDYPTPDGTCIRDYIHLADLVSAHVLALHALEGESALVYNVGSGQGYSVREVLETARRVTGLWPSPPSRRRWPGDLGVCWWPRRPKSRASWAGRRNIPAWTRSSPAPGSGTGDARKATRRESLFRLRHRGRPRRRNHLPTVGGRPARRWARSAHGDERRAGLAGDGRLARPQRGLPPRHGLD
ncbi:MAG: UDP-glucose 4-epimerase GalE [Anaerolineales bacterium]|nr:UDP-glucose 4-epimerase GalE [Anaerolineales bacterium]